MAIALARVIIHELVHALAPEHAHAQTGLMRGNLPRRYLLAPALKLDPHCRATLLESLAGARQS